MSDVFASVQRYLDQYYPDSKLRASIKEDFALRNLIGLESYGGPMEPHNGRDAGKEAYMEVLDASAYFEQKLMELNLPNDSPHPMAILFRQAVSMCFTLKAYLLQDGN